MANEINIAELRQLHAATTQGEWEPLADMIIQCNHEPVCYLYLCREYNRRFIIAAHNVMPALLDELERLRAEKQQLREALQELHDFSDTLGGTYLSRSLNGLSNAAKALRETE